MSPTAKSHDQDPAADAVRSPRNPRVVETARLHRRRHRVLTGRGLLEGPTLLAEAVAAGVEIIEVFGRKADEGARSLAVAAGADWISVEDRVLARLATTEEPQSPVAVFAIPSGGAEPEGHLLVAWGVGDPGNAGTLIRTAAAFGMGFIRGPGTADPWAPKVLRSAAGGHFHTSIGEVADSVELQATGRPLIASVVSGGEDPGVLAGLSDGVLLVGEEAEGLPADLIDLADHRVTIPMPGGTESLNAAVAGAIVAYELVRESGRPAGSGH